jgi:mannose-6-phosphate isomerase-like protein (cupin superfamily)
VRTEDVNALVAAIQREGGQAAQGGAGQGRAGQGSGRSVAACTDPKATMSRSTPDQVKRIVGHPEGKLSLQKHHHRGEHWVVLRGAAEVTVSDTVAKVHENESIYIPIGSVHRLANPGRIALGLIELQTSSYLGEDDIIRLDDVYRRS